MAIVKRKLKSGGYSYLVRVQDSNGQWYPSKQFVRKEMAKVYESSLIAQKSKGQNATKHQDRCITLSKFFHDTWKQEGRPRVSLGWRYSQDQMFRDHIEPPLGNRKVVDIEKQDISKLLSALKETKGLAPRTVRQVYILLNSIFNFAIEVYELRDSSPLLKKFKPKVEEFKPIYLDPDRARMFLALTADHWMGPAIWIMIGTGIRVGELIGLQYGDVDLVSRKINLRRQWRRKEKCIAAVKNRVAEKPIPINVELAEYLKEKLSPLAKPTDWVIQKQTRPGEMASYHSIQKTLKRLAKVHNFPHLTPHGLRHTTSGLWKETGMQRSDLRDLYNHSDDSTTKIYDHDVPERLNEFGKQVRMKKGNHLILVES